ncbi:lipopolysaccharide assembly protein LapA domain-containing protein [Lichenihabitans sp. PAMC28606]|uniref:lipopolysaccharide assembly protein LapA domain-containing protein n=1 Tax=Lichenihabitans sp. PAMC28606 TaxID=2880932 RepID=UPI001D09C666|nr:lipopolysaccharide assembly protein LapA domain-containing protein [Lichenihabitans sp. PAMC28606]UDL93647.1 lipopolysaccharide assembly protein LapA domain-containing protein [Lichenihabitans sp. PAMC28606]
MKTFLKLVILVPLALIAVAFAVANRQGVTVSFDPFATDIPAFALNGPLFVVILIVIGTGIIIGGIATWFGQGRFRREARLAKRESDELRAEVARLKADLEQQSRRSNDNAGTYPSLPGQTAA